MVSLLTVVYVKGNAKIRNEVTMNSSMWNVNLKRYVDERATSIKVLKSRFSKKISECISDVNLNMISIINSLKFAAMSGVKVKSSQVFYKVRCRLSRKFYCI